MSKIKKIQNRKSKIENQPPMPFNFRALEDILVCPGSRSKLVQEGASLVCVDPGCRLKYAIRDEIPIMLVDEAVKLSPEEWAGIMQHHARDPKTGEGAGPGAGTN
jgi:uncharacterized protein YbaR (Trm112 family)